MVQNLTKTHIKSGKKGAIIHKVDKILDVDKYQVALFHPQLMVKPVGDPYDQLEQ